MLLPMPPALQWPVEDDDDAAIAHVAFATLVIVIVLVTVFVVRGWSLIWLLAVVFVVLVISCWIMYGLREQAGRAPPEYADGGDRMVLLEPNEGRLYVK